MNVMTEAFDLGAARGYHSASRWVEACERYAAVDRVSPVLRLIVDGQTNAEIAANLHLSERTVHRHVSNILTKLGLPSRTAAAIHAVRSGLV